MQTSGSPADYSLTGWLQMKQLKRRRRDTNSQEIYEAEKKQDQNNQELSETQIYGEGAGTSGEVALPSSQGMVP